MPAHATQATVLFPDATPSPLNGAPWEDVFDVMADRFAWEGQDLTLKTFPQSVAASNGVVNQEFADACASCPVFVAVGMHGDQSAMLVDHALRSPRPVNLLFDSDTVRSSCFSLGTRKRVHWLIQNMLESPCSTYLSSPWPLGMCWQTV